MSVSIYDQIMDELNSREAYMHETYAPYYICSYSIHAFNLMNQTREVYFVGKQLPNMRLHLLFISPSGFMKTYYGDVMGRDPNGIFHSTDVSMAAEQTLCLPAGETINMADGSHKPVERVVVGDQVWAYDPAVGIIQTQVTATHQMQSDAIVHIQLQDGRTLSLTPNHPVYTVHGWMEVKDVQIGESIACPREYKVQGAPYNKEYAYILGLMLADGNFRGLTVYGDNQEIYDKLDRCITSVGCHLRKNPNRPIEWIITGDGSGNSNKIRNWLDSLGLKWHITKERKFIPDIVFTWDNESIAQFIEGLMSGDGHISQKGFVFTNLSENLVRGLHKLLMRFGIISTVWYDTTANIWKVLITSNSNMMRYMDQIGVTYTKPIEQVVQNGSIGLLPFDIWGIIEEELGEWNLNKLSKVVEKPLFQRRARHTGLPADLVMQIGEVLNSSRLKQLANPEIAWIKVKTKEVFGGEPVYNLSTECHTFIAGDIITHNTEAGFVGTIASVNGLAINNPGSAELNKNGILFIDEFKGITEALKSQMNSQMETQLLAALDHGHVNKRLGSGAISYRTFLTLWTGVQPGSYDLSTGLGRRLCVMIFVPTKTDNDAIMDIMHRTQNMRPDPSKMSLLWDNINETVRRMNRIERIELGDDILDFYHKQDMYSFETSYFNRIIIGYHLMTQPIEPIMHMDLSDKRLVHLLELQKKWRGDVYAGLDYLQIRKILTLHMHEEGGKQVKSCPRDQIARECAMIGWNSKQVFEKLGEMQKFGIIKTKGSMVILDE